MGVSNRVESSLLDQRHMITGIYSDYDDCGNYIGDTGKFYNSPAKKIKNVYHLIYETENLVKAQYKAQKGKKDRSEVRDFNKNITNNLTELYWMLKNETYVPGEYRIKLIQDPKERVIMIAPFFPDRVIHHCVINVLEKYWNNIFISNTYACIKGRGLHKCVDDIQKAMQNDRRGTKYCLKIDIKKFYDNVDHSELQKIIRYDIADEQLLWLLDKIIGSNGKGKGLPIGNYTSQYLANIYLAYFDHWVKEDLAGMIKEQFNARIYYFRYMDDMVLFCESKEALHSMLDLVGLYLASELKLEIKYNWQIFPVDARSLDYVGYVQNHHGVLLRKKILYRFYKKLNRIQKHYKTTNETELKHLFPSEYGWILKCSEEHKEHIFKKCIKNGNKCTNNRNTSL